MNFKIQKFSLIFFSRLPNLPKNSITNYSLLIANLYQLSIVHHHSHRLRVYLSHDMVVAFDVFAV